jgi:hypothetical protein
MIETQFAHITVVDGEDRWIVGGAFIAGPQGRPVCIAIEARVAPRTGTDHHGVDTGYAETFASVRAHLGELSGDPDLYSSRGIPGFVLQGLVPKLIAAGRKHGEFLAMLRDTVPERTVNVEYIDAHEQTFGATPRRRGRPAPDPVETLRWCKAADDAFTEGRRLEDAAAELHISVSTLKRRMDGAPKQFVDDFDVFEPGVPGSRRRMTRAAIDALERLEREARNGPEGR